jgi:hypothetical protein
MMLDGPVQDWRLAALRGREARAAAKAQQRQQLAHAKAVHRRERAQAEAREALPRHAVVTVAAALASWPLDGGLGVVAVVVSGISGLKAYRDVCRLRRPPLPPLPSLPVAVPAPHPRSAAFPAVHRLEAAHRELTRLLPLVAPIGREAAAEAWHAAAEADGALRWQAARLAAVEPVRGLEQAVLQPLYDGVATQERLVTAVADLVVASTDPLAVSRLQDATDALQGLAAGLREVRGLAG